MQQQGATVVGWFFLTVGLIGLVGATVETIQGDQPVLAHVISSKPLQDDETIVVTRVSLPDGRVGVLQSRESYSVTSQMKVVWEGEGDAYEEYSPLNRWIGSGLPFGVGALLAGVSRATREPPTRSAEQTA